MTERKRNKPTTRTLVWGIVILLASVFGGNKILPIIEALRINGAIPVDLTGK